MNQNQAREIVLRETLQLQGSNWLLELATGVGKSKLALNKIEHCHKVIAGNPINCNLLIVVHRNMHKRNWEKEIKEWYPDNNLNITFTTYVSFPKHKGIWDYAIFDECHHLSERCREALCDFHIGHSVLLSATVKDSLKDELIEVFDDLKCLKVDLREAIDNNILPDPKVYLVPLTLKDDFPTESIWKNPKAKGQLINCSWNERWHYLKQKTHPVRIFCTEKQYLADLNGSIEWWKKRYMQTRNEGVKAKWLRLCSNRLNYLADKKNPYIRKILEKLGDTRTLTFCGSIEQTEALGSHCINSKNGESTDNYNKFNKGIINHITACNMLNEGMNLVNCQVGIYANLNSSDTIIQQRAGRLLRHPNPIIIVPYYVGTREEELVNKMLENYNPKLVFRIIDLETMQYEGSD